MHDYFAAMRSYLPGRFLNIFDDDLFILRGIRYEMVTLHPTRLESSIINRLLNCLLH